MTGEPFNILPTTDSTNNHAMNEARMGQTSDGTAYFALDQYQGKGQRAKTWSSTPGENIILSVVKDCSGLQLNNQLQSLWPVLIFFLIMPEMKPGSNGRMISTGVTERQEAS
jgi:hypothetical protein